jgi:putative transposase
VFRPTIVAWLPVFTSPVCCETLVEAFAYARQHKGLIVHGWVIMDNHFHAVVVAPDLPSPLSDLKKFTDQCLLAQLEREGCICIWHLRHN